jgi:hypothetical protein
MIAFLSIKQKLISVLTLLYRIEAYFQNGFYMDGLTLLYKTYNVAD